MGVMWVQYGRGCRARVVVRLTTVTEDVVCPQNTYLTTLTLSGLQFIALSSLSSLKYF